VNRPSALADRPAHRVALANEHMFRQILGRVHCGSRLSEALRHVRACIGPDAWRQLPRSHRRACVAAVRKIHRQHWMCWKSVMGGYDREKLRAAIDSGALKPHRI